MGMYTLISNNIITLALKVGVIILFLQGITGRAQDQKGFDVKFGYMIHNQFYYGSFGTNSELYKRQGFKSIPNIELNYRFNRNWELKSRYASGIYFAQSPVLGGEFLWSIPQVIQLGVNRRFTYNYLSIGWSFVDHKFWNTLNPMFGRNDWTDHSGPLIEYGVFLPRGYEFSIGYDMVYDFVQDEFFYFVEFLNIRVQKSLTAPKDDDEKYKLSLAIGLEAAYNHNHRYYKTMPLTQKHLFAELEYWLKPKWSVFLKRSFWVDLELGTLTGQSEYIQTNNLGIKYNTEGMKHRIGLAHFMSNESLYDEIGYFRDSVFQDGIYKYHGASLSYERKLVSHFYLSTQVDMVFGSPIFELWYERFRPRVGLKYLL